VTTRVPADALMVCGNFSGAIYYYTNMPTLLFDTVEPVEFARYAALARNVDRPIYATIFDVEEEEAIRRRCPGAWSRVASAGNIGIWKLE